MEVPCIGQGAKVQLGPVRPTYLPSGQSLASMVQAMALLRLLFWFPGEAVAQAVSKSTPRNRGREWVRMKEGG